jgi:hypothetical protein
VSYPDLIRGLRVSVTHAAQRGHPCRRQDRQSRLRIIDPFIFLFFNLFGSLLYVPPTTRRFRINDSLMDCFLLMPPEVWNPGQ